MVITLNRKKEENGIRPLKPSRDLQGVASLIEEAFAQELDQSGRTALQEMRMMGRWGFLLGWLDILSPDVNTHLNGFVWLEEGQIIGNVTVSRHAPGAKHWFISNVAVTKLYRGRGVARALMTAAIEFVKEMQGYEISLQVRRGNTPAIELYKSLGFKIYLGHQLSLSPESRPNPLSGTTGRLEHQRASIKFTRYISCLYISTSGRANEHPTRTPPTSESFSIRDGNSV